MSGGFTGNPLPSQPTHEGYRITQNFSMMPLFDGFVDMETWITFHPHVSLRRWVSSLQVSKRITILQEVLKLQRVVSEQRQSKKKHPDDAVFDRVLQHHGRTVSPMFTPMKLFFFDGELTTWKGVGLPVCPNSGKARLSTTSDRKAHRFMQKKKVPSW